MAASKEKMSDFKLCVFLFMLFFIKHAGGEAVKIWTAGSNIILLSFSRQYVYCHASRGSSDNKIPSFQTYEEVYGEKA